MLSINFNIEEVLDFLKKNKNKIKVCFGIDSHTSIEQNFCEFVFSVTYLYLPNHGGNYFIFKLKEPHIEDVFMRLSKEVHYLVQFVELFKDFLDLNNIEYEVHLDISKNYKNKSNRLESYAKSYVYSMFGREPILKPDGFAASSVSDKFC
jgi:predicted RNase H-related nuclease YkuK (DUF458 family)